jgi:hypothetical protein
LHANTGRCGFCAVYKHFSGFKFFLLPGTVHARPSASNANRWVLAAEGNEKHEIHIRYYTSNIIIASR